MTFEKYKAKIADGDTVVLFLGYGNMLQITIEKGKVHQTKYGALKHSDCIGKLFGSKIQCSKGYIHVLYPTPELWTLTLPHRTQILYTTDISLITMQLDLLPGSVVIESGTGSASLSHAILRTVAPSGHLHTFDFHEERANKARVEFKHHGFGDFVTVYHRDVCNDGFGLENMADAVFLDLPLPWEAVPHAKKALKTSENDFSDIKTVECLVRLFDPKTVSLPVADLGYANDENFTPSYEDVGGSVYKPNIGQIQQNTDTEDRQEGDSQEEEVENVEETRSAKRKQEDENTANKKPVSAKGNFLFKSALTQKEMPGHTGFLTFATLYPR